MIRQLAIRSGIAVLILAAASCKDVPVDSDTGTVIRIDGDSTPIGVIPDTSCSDCTPGLSRTSQGLRQVSITYRAYDAAVPAKVTEDTMVFEPKVLLNHVVTNGNFGSTSADVLAFELITDFPQQVATSNIDWDGNTIKSLHVNVPEIQMLSGASASLAADPRDQGGASLAYRPVGTNVALKEMTTGDNIEGNISQGKATLTALDTNRRIASCHIAVTFWYRDPTTSPSIRKLAFEVDARFGY